jgi:hypothetical protein
MFTVAPINLNAHLDSSFEKLHVTEKWRSKSTVFRVYLGRFKWNQKSFRQNEHTFLCWFHFWPQKFRVPFKKLKFTLKSPLRGHSLNVPHKVRTISKNTIFLSSLVFQIFECIVYFWTPCICTYILLDNDLKSRLEHVLPVFLLMFPNNNIMFRSPIHLLALLGVA